MAEFTEKYNLKKPAITDFVDVADLNNNADKLDAALYAKADKSTAVAVSVPASGWVTEEDAVGYALHYDIAAEGVTEKDAAYVCIAPASMRAAADCGMCPVCETLEGKIRLFAAASPTVGIDAEYRIEQGKED